MDMHQWSDVEHDLFPAGMYGLIADAVASFCELPGSESQLPLAAELRRELPPEPSPDH